ncbi:hypothetical protein [Listeria costaricensis]|uniref:hypothetical protein n=1 Tax=Listeria costaricensis TaxID=2026604 RepID=UPI000C08AA7E|nr:hypothetical protein [Listeria costaricensis]
MQKVFEDEFMNLQSQLVSLCLELVGERVDNIYIYLSIEKQSKMFNVFFRVGEEIKTLNQMNLDNALVMQFLKIGTSDIEEIKQLCSEYDMPTPTEMKMYYEVKTGRYNMDCKYESVCSGKTGINAGEVFIKWILESKNGDAN